MITPGYALTATERVLPKLALDFTTASLDARVSLTRALNTATRINSSGYVETVNADLPRFDFTLNTGGACKGLLIEESRVNIIRRWSDFTQTAQWTAASAGGGSVPTYTGNTTLAPDGVSNAQIWQFTAPISGDRSYLSQTVAGLATGYWAASIFIKAGRAEDIGKIISIKETQGATYTLVTLTDQWQRPESINTSAATTHGMAIELRPSVNTSTGTVQAAIWGAQVEAGAFITSAIPNTGTASLTRNADAVSMTGTNFSDWFNAAEGTFAVTALRPQAPAAGRFPYLLSAYDAAGNRLDMYQNGAAAEQVAIWSGGSQVAALNNTTVAANTVINQVAAYKQNSFAANVNAGTLATDTAGNVPVCSQLFIGHASGSFQTNGWMQRVRYWPQRCINSEVTAFSKG